MWWVLVSWFAFLLAFDLEQEFGFYSGLGYGEVLFGGGGVDGVSGVDDFFWGDLVSGDGGWNSL